MTAPAPDDAQEMRALIERVGGVATVVDLALRWDISRQRVHELTQHPSFPKPVAMIGGGRVALYSIAEADDWRATPRRPGRPPKS